ncbi:uncharacterized protein LOC135170776 [Diachasmimorpha longicaudata]|uniref:uncharacterized protein LOC135170776 n=1 Tax=Diachasmimorpha longicaudata TaxID=58733 RepID=UPI0030B9082D
MALFNAIALQQNEVMSLRMPSPAQLNHQLLLRIFDEENSWPPVVHSCYVQAKHPIKFAYSSTLNQKSHSSPIITTDSFGWQDNRLLSPSPLEIEAYVLKVLTSSLSTLSSEYGKWDHLKGLELADPDFITPAPIDVIFGAGIVFGPTGGTESLLQANTHLATTNDELNNFLTKFWVQEEVPEASPASLSEEEAQCEAHFSLTHTRDSSGRYIVRLPLKSSASWLRDTRSSALACPHRLHQKFSKNESYRQLYREILLKYEDLGHMRRISSQLIGACTTAEMTLAHKAPASGRLRLLPTPWGAQGTQGDDQAQGAKLQKDISDLLLYSRNHKLIFMTDIMKIFREIGVHEDNWPLRQIL